MRQMNMGKKLREKCVLIAFSLSLSLSPFSFFIGIFAANSGLYAHYVFNTLDSDRSGIVSFEVSVVWTTFAHISQPQHSAFPHSDLIFQISVPTNQIQCAFDKRQ